MAEPPSLDRSAFEMKLLAYSVIGIVGFIFGIVAYVSGRHLPQWVRYSFLLFACVALGYGTLGYLLEHNRASLPYSARATLDHYRTLLAGMAIGVAVTLGISGQVKLSVRPRDEV